MVVYGFNEKGEYTGTIPCQLDPLESKLQGKPVYLSYQGTTRVAPELVNAQCPIFDGEKWTNVPDYRGKVAYDKSTKEKRFVLELGPIDENETILEPLWVPYEKFDGKSWVVDPILKKEYEKSLKIADIKGQLNLLDLSSIRYLRAVSEGTVTTEDKEYYEKNRASVKELREALKSLP